MGLVERGPQVRSVGDDMQQPTVIRNHIPGVQIQAADAAQEHLAARILLVSDAMATTALAAESVR